MIKCPYCQKETFDDSVFCGWCGKKMEAVTAVIPQEPRSAAVFEEPSPVVPVTSPSAPAKPVSGGKSLKAFAPLAEVLKDPLKRVPFTMPAAIAAFVLAFVGNLVLFSGISRSLFSKIASSLGKMLGELGMKEFVNTSGMFREAGIGERLLSAAIFTLVIFGLLMAIIAVSGKSSGKKFVFRNAVQKAGGWIAVPAMLVLLSAFLSFGLPTLCFFAILFALVILLCSIFTELPIAWNGWIRSAVTAGSGFLILAAGIVCLALFWITSLLDTIMRFSAMFG